MGKKKKVRAREGGKKARAKRPGSKKYKMYSIEDNKLAKKRVCPRCGQGVFLAEHKDRWSCGKCGYTEFKKKN